MSENIHKPDLRLEFNEYASQLWREYHMKNSAVNGKLVFRDAI